MATVFQFFPDLPAELRVSVWHVALEDDYDDLNGRDRIIELHTYNPTFKRIAASVSRRYPTLFEVNREARYEAAKAGGGEGVTAKTRFNGRKEPEHTTSFSIYINCLHDIVFISERFISYEPSCEHLRHHRVNKTEETSEQLFISILPDSVLKKILYLLLTIVNEAKHGRAPYKGKYLELFTALKRLHLFAHTLHDHSVRTRQVIEAHVYKVWESDHSWTPYVSDSLGPLNGHPEHHKTLTWMYVTGITNLECDGIRRVEWGLRKDFRVPRAKKGSGTLQKLD
ncbi:uncharacterized protein ALTATR162_LOCUS3440 [Alternaria atra]|uniref:2EXR domain-containing protein n=1 Tax=Alternaria atra TaxID=119953 RepID=A0A8J2HZB7_9PLEO|nr:uncharacterized protein ALTATR162_LOCUS3440 [Alternaria atra]CAG5154045.1 unnamed protein product [Alternaria atra]